MEAAFRRHAARLQVACASQGRGSITRDGKTPRAALAGIGDMLDLATISER